MKLSEMTTEMATKVLCDICIPVNIICEDEDAIKALKEAFDPSYSEKNGFAQYTHVFAKLFPVLLDHHKKETFTIISSVTNKPYEKVEKQNIMTTAKDISDIFYDKELNSFFTWLKEQKMQNE